MKKIGKILILLCFLLFLFIIYFNKNSMPFSFFEIQSGSMMPEIEVGEIVILFKCSEYQVNDIVTYDVKNLYFITHRIVSKNENGYITKGDYNNLEDKNIVTIEQIKGKVIFHSKLLGKIYKYRIYLIIVLILLLFIL